MCETERMHSMAKKTFTVEKIISILRLAEVKAAQGSTVVEICREVGITEQTYYRWRKEYGGVRSEGAKRLKDLEKENDRLKKLVAELSLENVVLRDAARGN